MQLAACSMQHASCTMHHVGQPKPNASSYEIRARCTKCFCAFYMKFAESFSENLYNQLFVIFVSPAHCNRRKQETLTLDDHYFGESFTVLTFLHVFFTLRVFKVIIFSFYSFDIFINLFSVGKYKFHSLILISYTIILDIYIRET